MKAILIVVVLIIIQTGMFAQRAEPPAIGDGTVENPYQIATLDNLYWLSQNRSEWRRKHFIQTADINARETLNWDEGRGWSPIGRYDVMFSMTFTGSYDGQHHVIDGLHINRGDERYLGLFGYTSGSRFSNIGLINVSINQQTYPVEGAHHTGGIIGRAVSATIENCFVTGTIIGSNCTGAIAGSMYTSTISGCYSMANIFGYSGVGGVIGFSEVNTMIDCSNGGKVFGKENVGGISGFTVRPEMTRNYNFGRVSGESWVGGLIGFLTSMNGNISLSFSNTQVEGNTAVGGLIGASSAYNATITNCYSKGRVSGTEYIGGFIGKITENRPLIINQCYSATEVIGDITGGFIASESNSTVNHSYWDINVSGQDHSFGGEGRFTYEMTYPYRRDTYSIWDFNDLWVDDHNHLFNNGYPYLYYQFEVAGYPNPPANPQPPNEQRSVCVNLEDISWDYVNDVLFTDPVGFRVYMNSTGEFEENHPFEWVPYVEGRARYSIANILTEQLAIATTYYWMVVPTTDEPERRGTDGARERRREGQVRAIHELPLQERGDARDVPVWRFTTVEQTTDVENEFASPLITSLNSNYPNPFNPETVINFSLAETGTVTIEIFNVQGQAVATLLNDKLEPGKHQITWNGRDEHNRQVGSGVYFYRMKTADYMATNKMILMK